MAFVSRLIEVTFRLASGTFAEGGNTVTVKGLRASAEIVNGGTFAATAHIRIYGMTLSLMNQLSTLQAVKIIEANAITISAGDSSMSSLPDIFTGTITTGWVDFSAQPQVAFDVLANASGFESVNTVKPASSPSGSDVITMLTTIAGLMNRTLENNGVPATPVPPQAYFPGTAFDQARKLGDDYNFRVAIHLNRLAIWPKDGTRTSLPTIPISKATGMIVSPIYTNTGLIVKTLFNGDIPIGSQIQVQSDVATSANRTWGVFSISHALESNVPKGQWFSTIEAYGLNLPMPFAVAP